MNYAFSLSHNNLVVETEWFGELTGEIISNGVITHNNWILTNSDKLPLVFLFDFSKANLHGISETDLPEITSRFSGIEQIFPGVNWIGVMPRGIKYRLVRMWLEHIENIAIKSHVVNSRSTAAEIITTLLTSYF